MKKRNLKRKIEKFKYKFVHIITYPVKFVRTLHERLLQHNTLQQEYPEFLNPYQVFFSWLFDTAINGILFAVIIVLLRKEPLIAIFKWTVIFGLLRYVVLDFAQEFKDKIN